MSREERRRAEIEARRARTRGYGRAAASRRARTRRIVGGAVLAVAAVAVAVTQVLGGGDTDAALPRPVGRAGSVEVADAEPVAVTRTPESFRIVYRVEQSGKNAKARTDVVSVRRPWDSRLDSHDGAPPGKRVLSVEVTSFGRQASRASDQDPLIVDLGPGVPTADVRLAATLEPALTAGLLERREVRKVLGRRCQVYRSGDYLSAATITAPTDDLHAESCIDDAGLLLEEVLVSKGRAIARRVAVEVDETPTFAPDAFTFDGEARGVEAGGGSIRRLKDTSMPPGEFFVVDAVPEGFTHRGRYSVVPPQPENFGNDPTRAGFRRAEVSQVWERGADVLIVDQGGTLSGEVPFAVDPANPTVDLGPIGAGEIRFSGRTNAVRILRPGGRYVLVRGTLAPDALAAVARSLRSIPGGTLEFAD